MTERSLKELIEEQFEADSMQLPVFNKVALELQELKNDDKVSMEQIAAVIIKDQSMASRVLQIANSSFYGGLKKVETITQAVVRLGMKRVINLAMVASQLLSHQSRVEMIANHMVILWKRSMACAVGARWLAEQSGNRALAEEAFLAGLMHDIGELFLLKVLEKLALDPASPLPLTEPLMYEVLEAMHNDLGYRLMIKWGLPEQYAVVARDHSLQEFDEHNLLLVMVRLMNIACMKLGIGVPPDPDIVLAATPEAQLLGLKEIKLVELELMLEDTVLEAGAML
jgi:HD-like signal output (HDOD) protein